MQKALKCYRAFNDKILKYLLGYLVFRISTDLFMAINPYPHKKGSHKGIKPNSEFLTKVSTPVLINRNSNSSIIKNPKQKISKSLA